MKAYVPSTGFQTPETRGELLSGRGGLGVSQPTEVVVVNDVHATPPTTTHSYAETVAMVPQIVLDIGLLEKLDVNLGAPGLTYQFWGDGRDEQGVKASAFVSGASASATQEWGTAPASTTADTRTSGLRGGVSVGNRWMPRGVVYATYSHTDYKVETKVRQTATTFEFNDNGYQDDLSIGAMLEGSSMFVQLELNVRQNTFSRIDKPTTMNGIGLLFGGAW